MSDYGSGDDLFDGDEAGAVLEHAASSQAQAIDTSPQAPLKRKFEDEEDEFDDLLAECFAEIEDIKKPRLKLDADDATPCPPRTELARKILRQTFGYDGFRLEQEAAISSILHGRNAMVVMPTGGGKSLCYQVGTRSPPPYHSPTSYTSDPCCCLHVDNIECAFYGC